jgi:hypothetical protein
MDCGRHSLVVKGQVFRLRGIKMGMAVAKDIGSCPTFRSGTKITELEQIRLWAEVGKKPCQPSCHILRDIAETGAPSTIGLRHVNRLRARWGLSRGKGRPRGTVKPVRESGALVELTPHMPSIGLHLFAAWLESEGMTGRIVELLCHRIEQYRKEHPDADFPLLHHKKETLLRRFEALFHAPLLGIGKLSELDMREHALETLVGVSYHGSTLNQFLGQLERIDAAQALLPALLPAKRGGIGYVDGHMIAFWTSKPMHKGKITMLGRIMAGSQAVVAHNEDGRAVFVRFYPPDIRMPHFILQYCLEIMETTGIEVFVIDREANSVELARSFEENGMGLLSMLDGNEYADLSSWTATRIGALADGSVVYEGKWAKPDDPRHFVLVQTGDRLLPYWGTSKVKECLCPLEWPDVYRERTEIQEHRFKEMKAHGALDVNYGTKKVIGPDRHRQRACRDLAQSMEKTQQRVSRKEQLVRDQQAKVAQSRDKGHEKRLEQRQQRLGQLQEELRKVTEKEKRLTEQLNQLGAPGKRADRDFRKQTIMTIRTLLLENSLLRFLAALCAVLDEQISLECLLKLLFERSGACLETPSEMTYWLNTAGLSLTYMKTLRKLAKGLCAMNLTCRGKPIRVRLREVPA